MVAETIIVVFVIQVHHIATTQVIVSIFLFLWSQLFAIDKRHHALHIVLFLSRQVVQGLQHTVDLRSDIAMEEISLFGSFQQHFGMQHG